jgi:hypothetical protein
MWNACLDADPSGQILTAWIAKEELRPCSPPPVPAATATTSHTGSIGSTVGA